LRLNAIRIGSGAIIALGAFIASPAMGAPARAADHLPASLQGEQFYVVEDTIPGGSDGTGTVDVTTDCAAGAEAFTLTYYAEGPAYGPYPGTFTESGTVTAAALTELDPPPFGGIVVTVGYVLTWTAEFTIDSPAGEVTGTKTQTTELLAESSATCEWISNGTVYWATVARTEGLSYEATIKPATGGTFTDEGTASAYISNVVPSVGYNNFFTEVFAVSSGVLPANGPPANVSVTPVAATNVVGEEHCVTATATDSSGTPTEDVTIYFTVAGTTTERDMSSGSAVTDADGQAEFCYTAQFPGSDTITAVADADDDGSPELGEPTGTASKTYVLPVSTPLCQVTISDGGWIIAANADRATFGGVAKAKNGEPGGDQVYQDHGPAETFTVKSTSVLAVVCSGTEATIYGTATLDSAGQYSFRIQVSDLSKNGKSDRYGILLSNGYYSGDMVLRGGNIVIKLK